MRRTTWHSDGLVAWTEQEGPGRPPAGVNPAVTTALGVGLGAVFAAIFFSDALCPEHRAWVQMLATVALVGTIVAAVGLIRRWAVAPVVALIVTLCGTAIGILDAFHSAARGRAIAGAFALLAFGAMVLLLKQLALWRWDHSVRQSLAAAPPVQLPEKTAEAETTAEADEADQTAAASPTAVDTRG